MTYPTPEEIKQIAIECEFASLAILGVNDILFSRPRELQAFAQHWIDVGRKEQREKDANLCEEVRDYR